MYISPNPIVISAEDLAEEYRKNHLRFEKTYVGKWVRVDGTVKLIGEHSIRLDELFGITNLSGLELLPPQPRQQDPRMVASVGESLTLTCKMERSPMVSSYIMFKGCHIYE